MIASPAATTKAIGSQQAAAGQPCGCTAAAGTCCTLDCLIQPRFFCGQLLTDADLTAILSWSEDKFRLARHRHGWGVVCGLDVHCDDKTPGGVVVDPGYAVDCCGNDVIVCSPQTVSLAGLCQAPAAPCANTDASKTAPETRAINMPVWDAAAESILKVDLFVSYCTEDIEPQAALGRGTCGQVGLCENSRTRGAAAVHAYPVQDLPPGDPRKEQYDTCLKVIRDFPWQGDWTQAAPYEQARGAGQRSRGSTARGAGPGAPPSAQDIRNYLAGWINRHPLHHLCYLKDRICDPQNTTLQDPQVVAKILFLIAMDCRSATLSAGCGPCDGDSHGVPLARVWLYRQIDSRSNRATCRVAVVEDRPPYRRPLGATVWPALPDEVDIAPALWQPPREARAILTRLGLTVAGERTFDVPHTAGELLSKVVDWKLTVPEDRPVYLEVFDAEALGPRVATVIGEAA